MAALDQVKVRKVYTDEFGKTNNGVDEAVSLQDFLLLLPAATTAGQRTTVTRTAAPVDPGSFADLAAAYTAWKAMRTALINAGVFI